MPVEEQHAGEHLVATGALKICAFLGRLRSGRLGHHAGISSGHFLLLLGLFDAAVMSEVGVAIKQHLAVFAVDLVLSEVPQFRDFRHAA